MQKQPVSIATIVIFILTFLIVTLLGIAGTVGYKLFSHYSYSQLRAMHSAITNQAKISLTLPLWDFDTTQLAHIAESMMQEKAVTSIVVKDINRNAPLLSLCRNDSWNVVKSDSIKKSNALLTSTATISYSDQNIGIVDIAMTTKFLEERLLAIKWTIFISISIVAAILTLILYLVLWIVILRPLNILEQYSIKVEDGTDEGSFIKTYLFKGELESLRLSLVNMVSLLKARHTELDKHRFHLEELVATRTTELTAAKAAAEQANKAKSMFLANMSHEFRTPLNAILGFTQIIASDNLLPVTLRDPMNIIMKSGEHLLSLINDVLDLARIESGKTRFEPVEFDLGSLLTDLIDMLRIRALEKGLRLHLDQSSSFPRFVRTDQAKLRQILINLVSNAIKFTNHGYISIKLALASHVKNDQHHLLLFSITDTGIGISKEDQKRLFNPFEQLGTSMHHEGTGLGLSIVNEYVKLLGGQINVESDTGAGSTFKFSIKYYPVNELSSEHTPVNPDIPQRIKNTENCRILIVEDHADNRTVLHRLLTPYGFQIREAINGHESIEITRTWMPNLIFMDRRMPDMDGIDATKAIRNLSQSIYPSIIAVTAHAYDDEQKAMLDAGCNGFIAKPYKDSSIFEAIRKFLPVEIDYGISNGNNDESDISSQETDSFGSIDPATRKKLLKASQEGDIDLIRDIVESNQELKTLILPLAEAYRFDLLMDQLTKD